MLPVEIRVENPFPKAANFQIMLDIESKYNTEEVKKKFGKSKKSLENKTEPLPDPFFIKQDKILLFSNRL